MTDEQHDGLFKVLAEIVARQDAQADAISAVRVELTSYKAFNRGIVAAITTTCTLIGTIMPLVIDWVRQHTR